MINYYYKCVNCGEEYDNGKLRYLCDKCSGTNNTNLPPEGVLKILYDYTSFNKSLQHHAAGSFIDFLPVKDTRSFPNLKTGNTPLYHINKLNNKVLRHQLYLKDDSQNPTFSFKDRASSLVSAIAKENGINEIITASTGNAGSSLAGICAANDQKAIVVVPANAPIAKLTQIVMYGATIVPVEGSYDDAFDLSVEATAGLGWYNRNTAFNPFTVEGKKTVSFEIYQQLGKCVPGRIFVPAGDGVIISGVYKGFEDLFKAGIIERMPLVVAVQAKGSDNLVRNINASSFEMRKSKTIADSISVDIPRNFYMTRQFIKEYGGETITVSDEQIIEASLTLSQNTGLFAEPAAATAFAGMLVYEKEAKLPDNSKNVVLLTGSGLKDINAVRNIIKIPRAISPNINELKKLIQL